jgi:hypothetical protein
MKRRVRWVLTLVILGALSAFVLAAMLSASGSVSPPPATNAAPGVAQTSPPRIHFIGTNGNKTPPAPTLPHAWVSVGRP